MLRPQNASEEHLPNHSSFFQPAKSIASKMGNKQAILPVCYFSALAQLARFSPGAFEQKSDVIMGFLVKRVLMPPSPVDAVRDSFCACFQIH